MAKTMQVEVWVFVSETGEYAVGADEAQAADQFVEDVGDLAEIGHRRIKVRLTVPVPETVTLTGEVPAEGDAELSVG